MSSCKDINKKWSLIIVICALFFLIKIDVVIAVQDNNTINNNMVKYVNVTSTRTMSILYVPIDQIVTDYNSKVDDNHEFLQETYPLREGGINETISQEVYNSNNVNFSTFKYGDYFGACGFLRKFNKERRLTQDRDHRVIGITYNTWFGERGMASNTKGYTCYRTIHAAILSAEGFRQNTAHETGHTYGLCDEYSSSAWIEENSKYAGGCPNGDEDDNNQLDNNCLTSPTGCPTITDKKVVPYESGEGNINLRNFMGDASNQNERWISRVSYAHLIDEFTNPPPIIQVDEAIMISGMIYNNNTVQIDPIYWLDNNTLFNETFGGNYSIIVKEGQKDYHSRNFSADFFLYNIGGNSTLLNESGFVFVLPATDSVTSIIITKNGIQLKEINISPNTPQVSVSLINKSEPIVTPFNLTWNATDVDNDGLYYAILVSSDNGTNYTTLDIDYQNKYYEIDPNDFDYSETYLFKIIVSDGTNTNYSYSNTIAMGVSPLTISYLTNITINTTHMLFEFVINNTGSTTLNNINWTLNPGDGSSVIKSDETFSLTAGSSAFVYVEYNYTTESNFIVNATANSGSLSNYKTLNINLGNATPSNLDVYDFSMYNISSTHKVFSFMVKNIGNQNLTDISWSLNTGLGTINSIYTYNLTPNNFSYVFVEYNYTQTGDFTPVASATSGSNQDSETLPMIDIPDIEASNLTLLYNNSLNRIFAFTISNMLSSSLNSVNWTFKPGDGNVISANQLFSLNSSENAFIFVEYNYSSTGTYNVNATAINGSLRDSTYYQFTIS